MTPGQMIYRCRMCGAQVREAFTRDLIGTLLKACLDLELKEHHLHIPHDCGDGRAGVMDLIGGEFKKETT